MEIFDYIHAYIHTFKIKLFLETLINRKAEMFRQFKIFKNIF